MLLETLATLDTLGAGAAALRYGWRIASAEDARRRDAIHVEQLRLQAQVEIERAKAAVPPAMPAHYAPVNHYHAGQHTYAPHIRTTAPVATSDTPTLPLVREGYVPLFGALLANGSIHRDGRLLLGFVDGKPLYDGWSALYSTAVAGLAHRKDDNHALSGGSGGSQWGTVRCR